ncbi:MAG: type IV pili methyl-accepting chemotaxis transducer N-terminal domain-containing protein, partial [Myxococcota bacterium]
MNRVFPSDSRKRVRNAYVVALALVALVTLWSQIVIQWSLRAETTTAATVNKAGLQRMRSQRLTKAAWESVFGNNDSLRDNALREANEALAALNATHEKLLEASAGGRSPHTPRSARMLEEVGVQLERFTAPMERLNANRTDTEILYELVRVERDFLPRMDALVTVFADTAQTRLGRVRGVEYALATVTLLLLLLEALLIFAPLSRRLDQTEKERSGLMKR